MATIHTSTRDRGGFFNDTTTSSFSPSHPPSGLHGSFGISSAVYFFYLQLFTLRYLSAPLLSLLDVCMSRLHLLSAGATLFISRLRCLWHSWHSFDVWNLPLLGLSATAFMPNFEFGVFILMPDLLFSDRNLDEASTSATECHPPQGCRCGRGHSDRSTLNLCGKGNLPFSQYKNLPSCQITLLDDPSPPLLAPRPYLLHLQVYSKDAQINILNIKSVDHISHIPKRFIKQPHAILFFKNELKSTNSTCSPTTKFCMQSINLYNIDTDTFSLGCTPSLGCAFSIALCTFKLEVSSNSLDPPRGSRSRSCFLLYAPFDFILTEFGEYPCYSNTYESFEHAKRKIVSCDLLVQAVLLLLGGREIPPGISGMPVPGHHHQKGLTDVPQRLNQPQRIASLTRFREKRKERCFDKKIRYSVRKEVALRMQRNKGQFTSTKSNSEDLALSASKWDPSQGWAPGTNGTQQEVVTEVSRWYSNNLRNINSVEE
eukprot:Gb_21623 [translate_table: standard]